MSELDALETNLQWVLGEVQRIRRNSTQPSSNTALGTSAGRRNDSITGEANAVIATPGPSTAVTPSFSQQADATITTPRPSSSSASFLGEVRSVSVPENPVIAMPGPASSFGSYSPEVRSVSVPGSAAFATSGPSSRSGLYYAEMRKSFGSYSLSQQIRQNQSNTAKSRSEVKRKQVFVCLGSPEDSEVPDKAMKDRLWEHGLGEKTVEFNPTATCIEMEALIRATYPKLEAHSFEILIKPYLSRKVLKPFGENFPTGEQIHTRKLSALYIRPKVALVTFESSLDCDFSMDKPQRFFLLQSAATEVTPNTQEEARLKGLGFGELTISLRRDMKSGTIEKRIREAYPALGSTGFCLLRRSRNGNNVALLPVDPQHNVTTGKNILRIRREVIYIRPEADLVPVLTANSSHGTTEHELFMQNLVCLGNPNEEFLPSPERLQQLNLNELGERVFIADLGLSSEAVSSKIQELYPKLADIKFSMLRASRNVGDRNLIPLDYFTTILECRRLREKNVPVVYILPSRDIEGNSNSFVAPVNENGCSERDLGLPAAEALGNDPVDIEYVLDNAEASAIDVEYILEDVEPSANAQVDDEYILEDAVVSANAAVELEVIANPVSNSNCVEMQELARMSDLVEVNELRTQQLQKCPAEYEHIVISRENMEELLAIYKHEDFKFERKTNIRFMGEAARDLGAVSKEFFLSSMKMLQSQPYLGKHQFFAGEMDHLVPNIDPILYSHHHFEFLGKFIAHSIIQTGVGFVGLSDACVRYLFLKESAFSEALEISEKDIPCLEKRNVALLLRQLQSGILLSLEEATSVQASLSEAGLFRTLDQPNAEFLLQNFVCHTVLLSREALFDSIRDGMKKTEVFNFFKEREHLWKVIFPKSTDMLYTAEDVLRIIRFTGIENASIRSAIENFVLNLESGDVSKLLQAWTGSNTFPEEGLEVKVKCPGVFIFHACFNQLEVPSTLSPEAVTAYLQNSLVYGYEGFGSA